MSGDNVKTDIQTAPRSRLQEDSGRKWLNVGVNVGNIVQASDPAIFYLTSAAGPDKSVSSGTDESAGSYVGMLEIYKDGFLGKVCIGGTFSIKGRVSGTYKYVSAMPEPNPSLGLHIQVIASYNEDGTINFFHES
ncbi:hypothetical protein [Pseudomonas sp. W2-17]|uniref:hypothetical protein n=1 Tax=Pseudomonas sp. W2-17 TaxID=3058039 RepID=UPI0034E09DCC